MKNFKRLMAGLLSIGMMTTAAQMSFAAEVSDSYHLTYVEDFDDAEKVLDSEDYKDGLFVFGQNANAENVVVTEDAQGGNYLTVTSGGADVQVRTKKGVFKHDVTVVDFYMRATSSSAFPRVTLLCSDAKMGANQQNGAITYVGDNCWRAYDLNNPGSYITNISYTGTNKWIPVRFILDSVNKTITTSIYGSQMSKTTVLENSWDNSKAQLLFHVAAGSVLMIDDLVVSDGKYMSNVFMDYDFENSSTVNAQVGNNFFYGVCKSVNPTVVYDAESENSYLNMASASVIYTNPFAVTANKPVVYEFGLKTDAATNGKIYLRKDSSVQPTMLAITNGVVDGPNKDVNVGDGKFHSYRITFIPSASNGYTATFFVDNNWIGNSTSSSNTYAGSNLDLRFNTAENSLMAIDNLKIYYPQEAKLFFDLDGKSGVSASSAVEMVSSTQINASSAKNAVITANGETVKFTTSSNAKKNSYIFNIEGGLQYATTYVVTIGAGVKDIFEQTYNQTFTFTTEEAPKAPVEAAISCKIGGEEATSVLKNGTMEVRFSVTSNIEAGVNAKGYLVKYDAEGNFSGVQTVALPVAGIGDKSQRVFFEVTDSISEIQLFIWDKTLKPLCLATELTK